MKNKQNVGEGGRIILEIKSRRPYSSNDSDASFFMLSDNKVNFRAHQSAEDIHQSPILVTQSTAVGFWIYMEIFIYLLSYLKLSLTFSQ